MKKLRFYDWTAYILLVIGGVIIGLTGFDYDVIDKISLLFYPAYSITRAYFKLIFHLIIGLAGIYGIYLGVKLLKNEKNK